MPKTLAPIRQEARVKIDKTVEDYNKKQAQGLEKKQRRLIEIRQNELDGLTKNYDAQKKDIELRHKDDLLNLTDKHNVEIQNEFVREEEYLANYQKDLQNQKQLYDKSLGELRSANEKQLKNIQEKHKIDLDNKFTDHINEEKTINDQINFDKKTFHEGTLREIKNAKHDEFLKIQDAKYEIDKNVTKSKAALSPTSAQGVLEQKEMTRLKHEKQLEIDRQARQNYIAENQLKQSHKFQIEQEQQNFDKNMVSQKSLFEKKYQDAESTQKEVLDRVQKKFDEDLKTLSESHAQKKTVHQNKLSDSFYRLTNIEPQITDKEKEYHIALKMPEHEKDNVQLTAQGRHIHLGYTRRFNESVTAEDGAKVTSNRSETVSKEFNLPDIVDPRKVVQKYEDGKVVFRIAKL